jgi:hypothetical protein
VLKCLFNPHRAQECVLGPILLVLAPLTAWAGGPKFVAGVSYFNPSVLGQPAHWANGKLSYYVDQGPLNSSVSNQQATAMVDAAAALWSAVPTAGVALTDAGQLNEDVSGANITASNQTITQPADVTPNATSYPVGVIFDSDGAVIDAILGTGASDPLSCQNNGVLFWLDNFNPDATMAHGVMILNGRCATTPALLQMMSFQLERGFGRLLGLDNAQVNPGALASGPSDAALGAPIMQPLSGSCGPGGGECVPSPGVLRYDDIAALNRIYPITASNLSIFPGKQTTSSQTISIQGTILFRTGLGMQGVNVVARPLDSNGNPLYQYTVTAVSGAYFNGNHGNPVTGWTDASGNRLDMWGSDDPALQGFFDLSGIPLPPDATSAGYQITFEAIDPLYILEDAVGPYIDGQPTPSGTLQTITLSALEAGSEKALTVEAEDSAAGGFGDAIGTETAPRRLPGSGLWAGRLSQVGQTDWFTFPVRGNRTFTVVTQALEETGAPTEDKAMPAIGVWDAFDAPGSAAIGTGPGMNGLATGESWLRVSSQGSDIVRIGIADERGDGRPDYPYNGWVLYADTVSPQRLPATGGPIVIHGMGFRFADTVLVGGQPAVVTSITPNEITAIAPPAAKGVTGSVDVEVDDLPVLYAAAIVTAGISYDAGTGDALTLVTAPLNSVPIGAPIPFTVTALGPDLRPAGGVTVLYTVSGGTATLACGNTTCAVTASGDGRASMNVTATDGTWSTVTASLANGSSLQAQFAGQASGGSTPTMQALTPQLSVAAGATLTWTVQALALNGGAPLAGQPVTWQGGETGIAAQDSSSALTNAAGIAAQTLTVGPLSEGQTATMSACLNGSYPCVTFSAFGARPEYAWLQAVGGTTQSLAASSTPSQVALRVLDMDGNPMAGATVNFYQALYAWTPECAAHGRCAQAQLLATQSSTGTSALDGSVSFSPASLPGVATNLMGVASTGNTSALQIAIEEHP